MQLSGGQLLDAGSTASTPYVAPSGATAIESVLSCPILEQAPLHRCRLSATIIARKAVFL